LDTISGNVTDIGITAKYGRSRVGDGKGDGKFTLLDDGTVLLAVVTEDGHVSYRGDKRITVEKDLYPWSHLMPSPDGSLVLTARGGHPFPCFVNGRGVGKIGEEFLRAQWSPDSKFLSVVSKDITGNQIISVNGSPVQRMDECLAEWFDGIVLRYFMRRGKTVSLASISLDGAPLSPGDAANINDSNPGEDTLLPRSIHGLWRIDTRRSALSVMNLTEKDLRMKLRSGEMTDRQMTAIEETIRATFLEVRADRVRMVFRHQLTDHALEIIKADGTNIVAKSINRPGVKVSLSSTAVDGRQSLVFTEDDGSKPSTLYFSRLQ
jgi:hypothetical protein